MSFSNDNNVDGYLQLMQMSRQNEQMKNDIAKLIKDKETSERQMQDAKEQVHLSMQVEVNKVRV